MLNMATMDPWLTIGTGFMSLALLLSFVDEFFENQKTHLLSQNQAKMCVFFSFSNACKSPTMDASVLKLVANYIWDVRDALQGENE